MKIFDLLEPHGPTEIAIFTVFITLTEPLQILPTKIHIFAFPECLRGSKGRRKGQKRSPKSTPERTADSVPTHCRAPNCPRTVGGLVLATPDELGDDNMIEIKLRSRLTTSNAQQASQKRQQHSNLRFHVATTSPRRHHRATRMGTAPSQPKSKPGTRMQNNQNF